MAEQNSIVTLNIGGTLFVTSRRTLDNDWSIFRYYCNPKLGGCKPDFSLKDKDGNVFIDRDPTYFPFILNFLRDGTRLALPEDNYQRTAIRVEAEFYQVEDLVEMCQLLSK